MSHLIRLNLLLTKAAASAAALAVIVMMLIVASDVFLKALLDIRIPGVSVIVGKYFMVAIAFLPLALTEAQDRNISVDLVYAKLPIALQQIAAIVIYALAALTCASLAWTMWDEAVYRFSKGTVVVEDGVSISIWLGYFLLPVGFALLTLIYLLRVIMGLAGAERARSTLINDLADVHEETPK